MPTLTPFILHSIGSPSQSSWARKEIKGIQIGKEEVSGITVFYIENKHSKKMLVSINEISKVAGYKINLQNLCF